MYTLLLLGVVLLSAAYDVRKNGIFACPASGYGSDSYLSYCEAAGYGDYDHGAFWFGLEPAASHAATSADVLIVGNSRTQLAYSASRTAAWFEARRFSYFLLGFNFNENIVFEAPLLRKLAPRARVYVVNIDGLFRQVTSPPVQVVFGDSAARTLYEHKRDWQPTHRFLCGRLPSLCSQEHVIYRSRSTGAWHLAGGQLRIMPVSYDGADESADTLEAFIAAGRTFMKSLPVGRECIILTQVPTVKTDTANATAVASGLGLELIAPHPDGLKTFDGSHLDLASAERWSAAFFDAAGPRIDRCLAAAHTGITGGAHDAGR